MYKNHCARNKHLKIFKMNKRPCRFIIYVPLILQIVLFYAYNNQILVLSCQSSPRVGKNLKIFETYKKRPISDVSNNNRIVKTLFIPKDYPTAGINNAYLDINSHLSSDLLSNTEHEVIENKPFFIGTEYVSSKEPITEDLLPLREEKYEATTKTVNIESKKEEEQIRIKKEGSGNNNDFQEKYIDNLKRRGELGSTRKSEEESSGTRKENGLLDDEEEGSGLHGYQLANDSEERNIQVHKRNSDNLEYGKNKKSINKCQLLTKYCGEMQENIVFYYFLWLLNSAYCHKIIYLPCVITIGKNRIILGKS